MAWRCNGYGVGLVFERSWIQLPAIPPLGNDSGQVVHTHVPLSPSCIIWYRPKRREGNGSMWERCGLPPTTELCLQLTAGSGPCKRRWAPTLRSQSCERAILTMGTFTIYNSFYNYQLSLLSSTKCISSAIQSIKQSINQSLLTELQTFCL